MDGNLNGRAAAGTRAVDRKSIPLGRHQRSTVAKRSIVIGRHKTSVSLEQPFWNAVHEIAHERNVTISELICLIDRGRGHANLSSAIRLFVLDYYRGRTMSQAREGSSALASRVS
jgi:predicted DNA-binding ribbon-helix-helix protein